MKVSVSKFTVKKGATKKIKAMAVKQDAKKKLSTINAARRDKKETEFYEAYRVDNCVYIVRREKEKKNAVKRGGGS